MKTLTLKDLNVKNKRVLLRLDLNVPLSSPDETGKRTITDDTRIREAIPTLEYLRTQGAKIIVMSHLGRPKAKRTSEDSLLPAAERIAELLKCDVTLADDCVGEGIELKAQSLVAGDILILENVRFHAEEEANDLGFAQSLARLGEVYVNDAFGTAHRKHASTYRLPSLMPHKAMGLLIEKEVRAFDALIKNPERPFALILGGAKVTDKIKTVNSLYRHVQTVMIGGAMAFAFMKARGDTIPASWKQPSDDDVTAAKQLIAEAETKGIRLILPIDTVDGCDIGPKTVSAFIEGLAGAKTVFWNGPLGWFEKPEYAKGTNQVAEYLSTQSSLRVVGGGDTVAAIHASGFAEKFSHLSTGGGAALEYIENGGLPGIAILQPQEYRPESQPFAMDEEVEGE